MTQPSMLHNDSDSRTRTELLPGSSQTMPSRPSPWMRSSPTSPEAGRTHLQVPVPTENRWRNRINKCWKLDLDQPRSANHLIICWVPPFVGGWFSSQCRPYTNNIQNLEMSGRGFNCFSWLISQWVSFFSAFDFQHSQFNANNQPMWLEVDGWILGERIPVCQELSKSLGKGFDLSFFHCCVLSLLFCSTIWHRIIQLWKTIEDHSQAIQSKWRWRLVVWARVVWIKALPGAQLWFETLVTASHSGCVYVDRFLEAVWLEKMIKIYQNISINGLRGRLRWIRIQDNSSTPLYPRNPRKEKQAARNQSFDVAFGTLRGEICEASSCDLREPED